MGQVIIGTGSGTAMILWIIVLVVMMYFLMIRPQKRHQDSRNQMLRNLKVNERILTAGGITGYIRQLGDEYIYVEIADGLVVELSKQSVAMVLQDEEDDVEEPVEEADVEETQEKDTDKPADDAVEEPADEATEDAEKAK